MKRRVLYWGVLLAIFCVLIVGIQGSNAEDGGNTGRFKTVETQVTQYIWDLVSNSDGHVICQVIVEHTGHPTNSEAIQICGDQIFPMEPTPTPIGTPAGAGPTPTTGPTAEPFDLANFFSGVSWRFVVAREFTRTVQVSVPNIVVNLSVPPGQQGPPFFVTITAYEPIYGQRITAIMGFLNGAEFMCNGARCDVPITTDSSLEFWATSSFGDESRHTMATLRINRVENQTTLEITSLTPIVIFQDACSTIWGVSRPVPPGFSVFPNSPEELNTMKPYQYLAGRLIAANVVNAKDCPGGGLIDGGAPNSCGLERASTAVIAWQNQYDVAIWEAARTLGIPPRIIKTYFEQESQFWPGNSRFAPLEFGLGQISQAGADVALRWDNDLFSSVCNGLIYDCTSVFGRLQSYFQATVRGGLVKSLDAECPTCPNGIDMTRVYDSIPVFVRALRSNCYQVKYIMDRSKLSAGYEDLWKFTLVSYHSGYQCLIDALDFTAFNQQPIDWAHVSTFLDCPGSQTYVDNFWKSLSEFDTYRIKPVVSTQPTVQPTFVPTPSIPTATPTPTPMLALSHIRVMVYVDANNNNRLDSGEEVTGVKVTASFLNGDVITNTTVNGEAIIDLTGRIVGQDVTVSLPELYRSQKVRVMQDGEIPVVFRLEQPVVPPALP